MLNLQYFANTVPKWPAQPSIEIEGLQRPPRIPPGVAAAANHFLLRDLADSGWMLRKEWLARVYIAKIQAIRRIR